MAICSIYGRGGDIYALPENVLRGYEYLATSPTSLDLESTLITLGLIGVGGVLYT
jgi:hypothetical protein